MIDDCSRLSARLRRRLTAVDAPVIV